MPMIDPLARIAEGAVIGEGAVVGPFCTIGPDVTIGPGVVLQSHVNVEGHTAIGARTQVSPFASLGGAPQSLAYKGEPTRLVIGEECVIRESVTVNRGTAGGGGLTSVGDRCYLMAYAHVGHDCHVGNAVIFANSATLGGHCTVGDFVFMGGLAAAHQFTRIGTQAMIGGLTALRGDVIPYGMVNRYGDLEGFNVIGMRRRGFTKARLHALRRFYHDTFLGEGDFVARLDAAAASEEASREPAIAEIVAFIRAGKGRPLLKPAASPSPPADDNG